MTIKDQILNYLNNAQELTINSNFDKAHNQLREYLINTYRFIKPQDRKDFAVESSAFALAKAMERTILNIIRPGKVSIWLVLQEIMEGAKFNLPAHIEDKIYDYMDACENAVTEYINSNLSFDFSKLLHDVQAIGEKLVIENKVAEIEVGGLSNDKVMTRDELHNFAMQGAKRYLEENNFKIERLMLGSASPVSVIASKDDQKYYICVSCSLLPNTPTFGGWRLQEFERICKKDNQEPYVLGVSLITKDEVYASMGVAIKEGEYDFKVSPLNKISDAKKPEEN